MEIKLIAPHPMNANVAWSTGFTIELLGSNVILIRDITNGSGMSVTNNMENVLCSISRHLHVWEDDLHILYTVYQIDDEAVYKINHEGCLNPSWVYMGPDDKAIRVLYGNKV